MLRFVSVLRGANARAGETFALRETPLWTVKVVTSDMLSAGRQSGMGGDVCPRANNKITILLLLLLLLLIIIITIIIIIIMIVIIMF